MVTSDLFIGIELAPIGDLYLGRQRLLTKGVTFRTDVVIDRIDGNRARGRDIYTNDAIVFEGYDTIVAAMGNMPDDRLYKQLKDRFPGVLPGRRLRRTPGNRHGYSGRQTHRRTNLSEFKYLFSPLKIGSVLVPNRIHFAAHMTNFGEGYKISDRHIAYYRERAKGGCGLITTEELSVHPSDHPYEKLVDAFEHHVIPGYKKLTRAIHEYDTKIFAQLNHNGMQGGRQDFAFPRLGAPPPARDPLFRETCKEMEVEDIQECIAYFARSAIYAVEGGFDGIELQLGHSSLIRQFLSPATNFREDNYGGSLENRMRFCQEVIAAVRKATGDDFTLGIRLNADEMHPQGGLTLQDTKEIARRLDAAGQLDFMDLSLGTFYNLYLVEGSMHTPLCLYGAPGCRDSLGGEAPGFLHQPDQRSAPGGEGLGGRPRGYDRHGAGAHL